MHAHRPALNRVTPTCTRRAVLGHLARVGGGAFLFGVTSFVARGQSEARGKILLEEDFRRYATFTKERLPVTEGWQVRANHGRWTRTDEGVRSTWVTGHSPVLVYEGAFHHAIVELDFRFRREPGRWAACRLSATNPQTHPRSYAASVWANADFRSRAVGLVLEHDEWNGPVTQVKRSLTEFEPDTWYTLRMELIGNEVTAACNGKTVKGAHDKFGIPKSSLWIGTGESSHELRRLRIYEASGK